MTSPASAISSPRGLKVRERQAIGGGEDPDTVELAWPNFGALNFVEFDRGSDLMTKASLAGIIRQHKGNNTDGDKALTNQHGSPSGARKNSAKPGSTTIEA